MKKRTMTAIVLGACVATSLVTAGALAAAGPGDAGEGNVFSAALGDIPGKRLTVLRVKYPPGGKSPAHKHAGDVFAYVLSGQVRSENSATGAGRVYGAGESFFEPAGSTHLVSENASATEPASFLAFFVADDGATLTTKAR
jgi:quercetin dioxygenase-like cupin family protein